MASSLALDVPPQQEQPLAPAAERVVGSPFRPHTQDLVDVGAVCVLVLLGLWGFRASFGGWGFLVVGGLGLALGAAIGYLTAQLRTSSLLVSLVALAAVIVFAGLVALPRTTLLGFVPTAATVSGLLQGFTSGWKDLITIPPPVGNEGNLLAIPYLCGFLGGLLGASGALRSTRLWWGALPPVAVLAAGILTGIVVPVSLLMQGAAFAVVLLGWAALRDRRRRSVYAPGRRFRGRGAAGVALLLLSGLIGLTFYQSVPGANSKPRLLLRSYVEPQVDLAALPSPLAGIRKYLSPTALKQPMLTVDGLPKGARMRLAVMDVWDGTAFGVAGVLEGNRTASSGEFLRTGATVPTTLQGDPVHLDVTIGPGYRDVWAPTLGGVTRFSSDNARISSTFRYNVATDSAVVTGGLNQGDHYSLDVVIPPTPPEAELTAAREGSVLQPTDAKPPESMGSVLSDVMDSAPAAGPYERAKTIVTGLSKTNFGFYAAYSGPQSRPPGHGYYRLDQFFKETPLAGDEEQYGAVAALMAREVGVPTRLVMGFKAPDDASGDVTLYGSNISVWLEINLDGIGWVPIDDDPTPERDHLPQQIKQPTPKPQPQVQPPPMPQPQATIAPPDQAQAPSGPQEQTSPRTWLPHWVLTVALYVGVPLVIIWAIVGGIVGAKSRRSRRRRNDPDLSRAITGGWTDLLDRVRDSGYEPSRLWTRSEAVRELSTTAAAVSDHLPGLAARADQAAFSPDSPRLDDVVAYWADVASAQHALTQGMSWWRRLRTRLSLRSIGPRDLLPHRHPEGRQISPDEAGGMA